jgi:hypothetical protein
VAVADGPGASASAIGGCTALDNSTCNAPNTAIADGPGSTALAVGLDVYAENNSTAEQAATAIATDGGKATSVSNAGAVDNSVAESASNATADGAGSMAAGGATAEATNGGVAIATNAVTADQGATAIGGSTSMATGSSSPGGGVTSVIACTAGQVSCGSGFALALGGSGEAFALTDTNVTATDGQTVNVAVSAIAPAQAGIGCTGGAYANLVQNADGSWVFAHGANAGFACTDETTSVSD